MPHYGVYKELCAMLWVLLKKVLLKISPSYGKISSIQTQLENMQNSFVENITGIRIQLDNVNKMFSSHTEEDDKNYLHTDVPMAKLIKHPKWIDYLAGIGNRNNVKILEIGSRLITGYNIHKRFPDAKYTGFDLYAGENVDVVGDAHKLSAYFEKDEKFDIIFSSAVFEHFAMPWIVAQEIAKMLKIGGLVFVETHFSYSSHERPWHFFQFTDMGLKVLFSPALGFECIEAGFSTPIVGRFSSLAIKGLKNKPVTGLYCHVGYLGKKIREVEEFEWGKIKLQEVVEGTKYPELKEGK
jgi:SAM-dependent methyltransferase